MAREQHSIRQKSTFDEWAPDVAAAAIKAASALVGQVTIQYNDEDTTRNAARLIGTLAKEILDEVGKGR